MRNRKSLPPNWRCLQTKSRCLKWAIFLWRSFELIAHAFDRALARADQTRQFVREVSLMDILVWEREILVSNLMARRVLMMIAVVMKGRAKFLD